MRISIPVSVGELIDRITILEIKLARIKDATKLQWVIAELGLLEPLAERLPWTDVSRHYRERLALVNQELWDIEDFKRQCEREQKFDEQFITAAREVYMKNDLRARIKAAINTEFDSDIQEAKSHDSV